MKLISVVTPCYNEEDNVELLYQEVRKAFAGIAGYAYEHIFIDNNSKDRTVAILKELAARDKNVKIIVNTRNFGHIRSPFHALLQTRGDAAITMVADLQDPPMMIPEFIRQWEAGYKVVIGIKAQVEETPVMFAIRKAYYNLITRLSEVELIKNFTGFGLFDREVVDTLRKIREPYPYFRGLIADLGYQMAKLEYVQPTRKRGITKNNFYALYDTAVLGITNHSKVPLRLAAMLGFAMSIVSILTALFYFIYKLIFWESFTIGIAPIVIGSFFFASVQLFFLGIIGEYIGSIHTQVLNRPLVIEKERVNFDQ